MKYVGLVAGLCGIISIGFSQNTVVTDDAGYTGNASAMLDVKSTSKGLLLPRVSLTDITDQTTIGGAGAEPDGLLIYDEGTNIPEGFYFWDNANTVWVAYGTGINGKSIFVGQASGANDDDDAQNNTAIGYESAKFNETGTNNTFIGYQSGLGVTGNSFSNNTAMGYQSGLALTTGSNNSLFGYQSGLTLSTGSSNVFLGYLAGSAEAAGTSNKLFIENSASSLPLVYGEFDNDLLQVNGEFQIKNGSTSAGVLRIFEDSDDGTNKVSVTVPALAADYSLTLPTDDGTSGQALVTDGSGVLSWTDPASTSDYFVFPETSGSGIKVDLTTPTYPWHDIIGEIVVKGTGSNDPPWTQIGGSVMFAYNFDINDECWISYHIPHDYAQGTDIYLHVHWLPSGTDANSVKWQFDYVYADGHNQEAFNIGAETTVTVESASPTTQYQHMVSETVAQTIAGCEPDGIIYVHIKRITNGATENADDILVLKSDVHYQSTGIGTKGKAPSFY